MSTAKPDELFHGLQPRDCGEHRTCGGRAWCFDCTEWCSPALPCTRCELPAIRAELERLRAEVAAARASQPAQSPSGPGDGHGAAPGNQGSPAARTEPRAMRPEDVPDDVLTAAKAAGDAYDVACDRFDWQEYDRAIVAAVIPAIEARVRAQVADRILTSTCPPGEQCANRWCPDCVAYRQAVKDANLARGEGR